MKNQSIRNVIYEDPYSDRLVVELWLGEQHLAEVWDPPPYSIKIYSRGGDDPWEVQLDILVEALERAKLRMDEMLGLDPRG